MYSVYDHTLTRPCKPCGNTRSIDLPRKAAQALQAVLPTAPAFLNSQQSIKATMDSTSVAASMISRPCGHMNGGNTSNGSRMQPQAWAQPQIPTQQSMLPPQLPQQSAPSIAAGGFLSQNQNPAQSIEAGHVYLCVKVGSDYHFSDLKVHELKTDVKVFSSLRREYLIARKGFRNWFSMWRYDHCDFFLVRHIYFKHCVARSNKSYSSPSSQCAAYHWTWTFRLFLTMITISSLVPSHLNLHSDPFQKQNFGTDSIRTVRTAAISGINNRCVGGYLAVTMKKPSKSCLSVEWLWSCKTAKGSSSGAYWYANDDLAPSFSRIYVYSIFRALYSSSSGFSTGDMDLIYKMPLFRL
jgi:hypothetical protein